MKKHLDIFIEGKLEKADFNFYSQSAAIKFKVNAIYKNGDTRHIEIEVEGNAKDVDNYANFIKEGALTAHIELFRTEEGTFKNIEGFTSLKVHKEKYARIKSLLKRYRR
ncbi:MAG: acylphosphatase [Bacteroidales bacterium]|nr:acylphosphatase [Bacteroidales bacterium]